MAFGITAIGGVRFLHPSEGCRDMSHEHVFVYDDHIARIDGREQGCYAYECRIEKDGFNISGYTSWRKALSVAAMGVEPEEVWNNLDEYSGGPFFEIVHMSDNTGAYGPVTSAKLYQDFASFRDRLFPLVKKYLDEHPEHTMGAEYWLKKYDEWIELFRFAAEHDGFVIFY